MSKKSEFDYSQDVGPKDANTLKCDDCGVERAYDTKKPYNPDQADCPDKCGGQMMSWNWCGWKGNPARRKRFKLQEKRAEEARKRRVSQKSDSFDNFTIEERNIHGLLVVEQYGTEAPWMSAFGSCLVKIFGIRRRRGKVQFGIGNEEPPILGWVTKDRFFNEWPS